MSLQNRQIVELKLVKLETALGNYCRLGGLQRAEGSQQSTKPSNGTGTFMLRLPDRTKDHGLALFNAKISQTGCFGGKARII